MKNIVVIGGGTGVFTVLSGLKYSPLYKLCAIVSMADDGGSTGQLREEFGVLPAGDIRRALIALSGSDKKIMTELFNFRFENGKSLAGHSLGNLLLMALEKITGSFQKGLKEAVNILNVNGEVIPVTLENTRLYAELEDGKIIKGETNIDVPKHDGNLRIEKIFLKPQVGANPEALKAIKHADAIVLGPGDLFTSVLPNLAVEGIVDAIKSSRAKKIYIVNIMTKFGETNGYKVSDFINKVESYLGKNVLDYCIVNSQKPVGNVLKRYLLEHDRIVEFDKHNLKKTKVKVITGRFLRRGQFLRHDPEKLAKSITFILEGEAKDEPLLVA